MRRTDLIKLNTPIKYKVQHWYENLSGGFDLLYSVENFGTIAKSYLLTTIDKEGFKTPSQEKIVITNNSENIYNYYYIRETFFVTFNNNDGILLLNNNNESYKYGEKVYINNPTIDGNYAWDGWEGDVSSIEKSFSFTMPAQNITITPKATLVTYYEIQDTTQNYGIKNLPNYLWQEHPCPPSQGGYLFNLGYNKVYRYTFNEPFDISNYNYFVFDIQLQTDDANESDFAKLRNMSGQIEFSSAGVNDKEELTAALPTAWNNSVYSMLHDDGSQRWRTVYIPLNKFADYGIDKTKVNFLGVYWNNYTTTENYFVGQMANPRLTARLPEKANKTF